MTITISEHPWKHVRRNMTRSILIHCIHDLRSFRAVVRIIHKQTDLPVYVFLPFRKYNAVLEEWRKVRDGYKGDTYTFADYCGLDVIVKLLCAGD